MDLKPHVFREYDIRGIVDEDLSEEFAYLLGRAYSQLAQENSLQKIVVGHDCRLSSPGYAARLADGITDGGCDVVFTGLGPTPQMYFALFQRDLDGGIQVTGSHNPSNMNGFKICLGKNTLSGDDIQNLYKKMSALQSTELDGVEKGSLEEEAISEEYIDYIVENCKPHLGARDLKIVVDAGNGVGGMIGVPVLKKLGFEIIELFCEPDGNFPNHHPDPTVIENIQELIKTVKAEKADFGIGWDGDGDRIGVIDEKGEPVFGDMLLLLFGREILKTEKDVTIIGDVKCSSLLFETLSNDGAQAIMWKTGHSLIKKKLIETKGALAGEMSGHIFFKHRFFGFDDALYSSARLCEIVSKHDGPFSALLSDLPKMYSTPEIRTDCEESLKFRVASEAPGLFPEYEVSTIDGARIQFEKGWGLVRASNTQPVLVMRFEAENPELLNEYRELVEQRISKLKAELA